jgi:hypothetical protein
MANIGEALGEDVLTCSPEVAAQFDTAVDAYKALQAARQVLRCLSDEQLVEAMVHFAERETTREAQLDVAVTSKRAGVDVDMGPIYDEHAANLETWSELTSEMAHRSGGFYSDVFLVERRLRSQFPEANI